MEAFKVETLSVYIDLNQMEKDVTVKADKLKTKIESRKDEERKKKEEA